MIDTMMFRAVIPAGTYAAGTPIPLDLVDGPSVVRDGYGSAFLKRVFTIGDSSGVFPSRFEIKNQNWVDSLCNICTAPAGNGIYSILAKDGPCCQNGGDVPLQVNSAFSVDLIPSENVTTSADCCVFCLIDIDYPQVAAVANPNDETGTPMSIFRTDSVTINAFGTPAGWDVYNVDEFKAGYRYLLAQVGAVVHSASNAYLGFVKISGTAGQNGLSQIIPICPRLAGTMRYHLEYSTPMVKGPMTISYMVYAAAAGTDDMDVEFDYIRR